MTEQGVLGFPGRQLLAGWWRQLARWQPRSLWVGHLWLHHVEALAACRRTATFDPVDRLVLKALLAAPAEHLAKLDEHLHLGRQVLAQVLRGLQAAGLAEPADTGWSATAAGKESARQGDYPSTVHERRTFAFVESEQLGRPPHFLQLGRSPGSPFQPGDDWHFNPAWLEACLQRPSDWKRRHGFPEDVEQIIRLGQAEPWRQVIVDRPETLSAALVLTSAEGGERLLGFAACPEKWTLTADEPIFALAQDWREVLPDLAVDPALEQWREAWQAWCDPRHLPAGDLEPGGLEFSGDRLRVRPLPALGEKLRKRADILKGEAWLLAAAGRVRRGALIEVAAGPATASGT